MSFKAPEQCRLAHHPIYGPMDTSWGNNGVFFTQSPDTGHWLNIIASDGAGWEHVSVSIIGSSNTPSWADMAFVKDLFWGPEDAVMQLHPPHSEYVNNHEGCLHLWRPIGQEIPLPDSILVGDKNLSPEQVGEMAVGELRSLFQKSAQSLGFRSDRKPCRPIPTKRPNIRNGKRVK